MTYPTAILTADWHLRDSHPACRTDDFWQAQWDKVEFICNLGLEYNCPIIHAGDMFHSWKASPHLISTAIEKFKGKIVTVYGNHDMPQHNIDLAYKSGLHTLMKAGKIHVLEDGYFGGEPAVYTPNEVEILVWHKFVYKGELHWAVPKDEASSILRTYGKKALLLTGDNHETFTLRRNNKVLVNPGSITRQTAAQADHEPCVFVWYEDTNEIDDILLPYKKDVISREHLENKEAKDERIEAFISRLKGEWEASVSFERNIEQFLSANKVRQSVIDLVRKAIAEEDEA